MDTDKAEVIDITTPHGLFAVLVRGHEESDWLSGEMAILEAVECLPLDELVASATAGFETAMIWHELFRMSKLPSRFPTSAENYHPGSADLGNKLCELFIEINNYVLENAPLELRMQMNQAITPEPTSYNDEGQPCYGPLISAEDKLSEWSCSMGIPVTGPALH